MKEERMMNNKKRKTITKTNEKRQKKRIKKGIKSQKQDKRRTPIGEIEKREKEK